MRTRAVGHTGISKGHWSLLALALLLAAASVSTCMLMAVPAMASPAEHGDCDDTDDGTSICPHQELMQSNLVSEMELPVAADVIAPVPTGSAPILCTVAFAQDPAWPGGPPGDGLVSLRL